MHVGDLPNSGRSTRKSLAFNIEAVGLAHLVLPVAIVLVATGCFAAGWKLSAPVLLPSAILYIACIRIFARSWRLTAIAIGLTALTYAAGYAYALSIFDSSWDGLFYHQEAVLQLAEGWNPLFEGGAHEFIEHYPKASWISGATMFLLTGKIEAGKIFQIGLIVAAWYFISAILIRFTSLSFFTIGLISLLGAANPVAIYQSSTYLNDGLVASSFTILLVELTAYIFTSRRRHFVPAVVAALFLMNLKFTALAYVLLLLVWMAALVWIQHGSGAGIRAASISCLAIFAGVFLLGYAPYVRNFVERGAFLYPVYGEGKEQFHSLMISQVPPNLRNKNRVTRFLISNFSKTDDGWNKPAVLKFPFAIFRTEAAAFKHTVIRTGGFGPFSGLLLIAMLIPAIGLLAYPALRQRHALFFLLTALLLLTIFIHDIGWWARFAPQAWLLPLLWATAALLTNVGWLRWAGRGILALAFANVIFVTGSFLYQQRIYTVQWKDSLKDMRSAAQPVPVYLSHFSPLRQRLGEAGIQFTVLSEPPPETVKRFRIPGYASMYWVER